MHSEDNPLLHASRKAKALASVLNNQPALDKLRLPWLDALIYLSADDLPCDLTGNARNRVLLKDRPKTDTRPAHKGVPRRSLQSGRTGDRRQPARRASAQADCLLTLDSLTIANSAPTARLASGASPKCPVGEIGICGENSDWHG